MLNACKRILFSLAVATTVTVPSPAVAAPRNIEQFDQQTWQKFQTELPRPSVVVFSTTDCAHCPAVIEKLAAQIRQRKLQAPLIVVLMDEYLVAAQLKDPHYRNVNRLFAFSGQASALQHSISPKWRGVTPYVALFPSAGEPRLVTGGPSENDIVSWLEAGKNNLK
ncbi:hypothetical protein BH11PSE11_BH11PSE11_10580 [soil metagenome]